MQQIRRYTYRLYLKPKLRAWNSWHCSKIVDDALIISCGGFGSKNRVLHTAPAAAIAVEVHYAYRSLACAKWDALLTGNALSFFFPFTYKWKEKIFFKYHNLKLFFFKPHSRQFNLFLHLLGFIFIRSLPCWSVL